MSEIIRAVNISKQFNPFETALKGVTLNIKRGMFHVLLGQSGSGKSTLLNIMSSLLKPTSGQVFYSGKDITRLSKKEQLCLRREKFSNIFQEYFLLPELTVSLLSSFMYFFVQISVDGNLAMLQSRPTPG